MKYTLERIKKVVRSKGGKLLSEECQNSSSRIKIECAHGHQWETSAQHLAGTLQSWCQKCNHEKQKYTIEEMHILAEKRGGKCLSNTYASEKTKLLWQCQSKHQWESSPDNIVRGTWCKKCAYKKLPQLQAKHSIDDINKIASLKGGSCINPKVLPVKEKQTWRCTDGHIWSATLNSIISGHWCPYCTRYREQEKTRFIFEKLTNKKFPKFRIEKYWLDGYCKELNIAFEYNGEQHYKKMKQFHKTDADFEKQKERDFRVKNLCKNNDITLIEIPYNSYKSDEELIDNISKILKINSVKIDIKEFYKNNGSELKKLYELARGKGGELLSDIYINSGSKLKWKCGCGNIWEMSSNTLKSGGQWCPKCGRESMAKKCRLKTEDLQKLAAKFGGKYILGEYKNTRTNVSWSCKHGHIFKIKVSDIQGKNRWCPICKKNEKINKKNTLGLILAQEFAKTKEGECLSTEYKDTKTPLIWKCKNSHVFKRTLEYLKHMKAWCSVCNNDNRTIKKINNLKKIAESYGGECLSKTYKRGRKLKWKCSKGHLWESKWSCRIKKLWCPQCSGNINLTIEHAKERDSECLSTEYKNRHSKLIWQCKNNHTFVKSLSEIKRKISFKYKNNWCPVCYKGSKKVKYENNSKT